MYVLFTLFINIYYLGGYNDDTTTYNIETLNIVKGTALTLSEVDFVIIIIYKYAVIFFLKTI
jgi:hypothetical protein